MGPLVIGVRTLQAAYDVGRLIKAVSAAPEYATTVRALSTASVSLCQAVMSARVADYEHEVVVALAGHLERAGATLAGQGSATAAMARAEVGRAVGLLHRMHEVDWTGEMADAA